jgi:hypothetical protein
MSATTAWIVLLLWLVLPTLHVLLSAKSGSWRPPAGSKCPFGPRAGWLVIVLLFGLIGWLLFLRSRPPA